VFILHFTIQRVFLEIKWDYVFSVSFFRQIPNNKLYSMWHFKGKAETLCPFKKVRNWATLCLFQLSKNKFFLVSMGDIPYVVFFQSHFIRFCREKKRKNVLKIKVKDVWISQTQTKEYPILKWKLNTCPFLQLEIMLKFFFDIHISCQVSFFSSKQIISCWNDTRIMRNILILSYVCNN
jgi:hypothetical protein